VDQVSIEGLQALAQSDPKSLDMALLDPLRDQLSALQDQLDQAGDQADPAAQDQLKAMSAAVDALVEEQISRLDALAKDITDDWQKAVKAKATIENRWIDDERQFAGKPRVRPSKAYPGDAADKAQADNDPIQVHATRSRTLMCWGRLSDMMLPANDYPIRIDASDAPDPAEFSQSLPAAIQKAMAKYQAEAQAAQQANQPEPAAPNPKDVLSEVSDAAANEMQTEVFQLLRDADFASHMRKALLDCARIGCGLIKGPFPQMKQTRTFGPDGSFQIKETPSAGFSWVDPWKFYYDMAPSLARSSATYEVQLVSKRELADFKRYPRTITSTIDSLLEEKEPKLDGAFRAAVTKRNEQTDMKEPLDDVYAVLETHKVLDPDDLKDCMGIDWPHEELPVIHFWSVNGRCIKFKLTPLERDFRLDYYNVTIMPADDTIFGYGYPYLARAAQRFTDGAVAATLANAAASVAPMLLVSQGKVHPNREQWRAAGLNIFSVENQSQPLENFFASVSVQSNVEQNLELLKVAQDMMDQDTLFNQILQGNVNGEEMPASGFVMASNIASVFQKQIAAYADDNAFKPLGERAIWWVKMYGPEMGKPPIEGDMQAKGIAATQLVSKDLALQHTQAVIQAAGNPMFAGFSDAYELWKGFIGNVDGLPNKEAAIVDRDTAMANQQRIQQMAQQGDPNVAAKIASDEKIATLKLQTEERIAAGDQQVKLMQSQVSMKVAQLTLQARLVELETQKNVDLTQISATVQQASMDNDTRRMEATLDNTIKARIAAAELNATPSPFSAKD
jgi:hypothetical protein